MNKFEIRGEAEVMGRQSIIMELPSTFIETMIYLCEYTNTPFPKCSI